jgi:hypothetical protein
METLIAMRMETGMLTAMRRGLHYPIVLFTVAGIEVLWRRKRTMATLK